MSKKFNFKNEQLDAINHSEKNTIVFASAGAGKTRVLIERLTKKIIDDKISLNNIVAMTFTEAAAQEMKSRLENSLNEKLVLNPNDEYIKTQISLIANSNISTIHSFCLTLLKKYYFLLGINRSRLDNILDETFKLDYLNQSIEYGLKHVDLKFLQQNIEKNLFSYENVIEIIKIIFNKVYSQIDPIKYLDEQIIKREDKNYFNEVLNLYTNSFKDNAKKLIKKINNDVHDLQSLIDLRNKLDMIVNTKDINEIESILLSIKKVSSTQKYGQDYKLYRDNLNKDLEKLVKPFMPFDMIEKTFNIESKLLVELFKALKHTINHYEKLKLENNVCDFDDFEHLTYKLLSLNNNYLSNILKQEYKEIMIDEFQDTNDVQFAIVNLLNNNNNLFIVGDPKQSIYGFRNANPEIMNALANDNNFKKIVIPYNFRSTNTIVYENNTIYEQLIDFYNKDFDNQIASNNSPSQIEILNFDESLNKYELIVHKVNQIIESGQKLNSIMILTRSNQQANSVHYYLNKYGIKSYVASTDSYLKSTALDVISSYLSLIVDKSLITEKVSVLTSSMYKLSMQDVFDLKKDNFKYEQLETDLNNLIVLSKRNSILEIIEYILNINDYYNHLDKQDKASIDLFIKDALNYTNIYDLLDFIEQSIDTYTKQPILYTKDDDIVQVMTIHKSKGLEAKNVILLANSNDTNKYDQVIYNKNLGFAINVFVDTKYKIKLPTITYNLIKHLNTLLDRQENMRLLYVATTRPKDNLYIISKELKDDAMQELDDDISFGKILNNHFHKKRISFKQEDLNLKKYTHKTKAIDSNLLNKLNLFKERKSVKVNTRSASYHDVKELNFNTGTNFGTQVHNYFELLDFKSSINQDEIREYFDVNATYMINAVSNFLNSEIISKINLNNYEIYKEYPYINVENMSVNIIDLFAKSNEEIILIDYKTDNKEIDELKYFYHEQLNIYANVLHKQFKLPVLKYIYSTKHAMFIKID